LLREGEGGANWNEAKRGEAVSANQCAYFAPGAFRGYPHGFRVQQRSTRAFKGVLNTFWQMVSRWVTTQLQDGVIYA
jgi:hypothetical protein